MKKLKFLFLPLLCLSLACSDDDGSPTTNDPNNPQDSFSFNNESYMIADGKSVNNHHITSQSHTQYSFVLADAPITTNITAGSPAAFQSAQSNAMIHLRAYAQGESLTTGAYTVGCCDERYYTFTLFTNDETYSAEEGTVVISGSAPNYVIEFKDIALSSGEGPLIDFPDFIYNDGFDFTDND